jgi:N-acetylmuramoyl-L-alanine amidase
MKPEVIVKQPPKTFADTESHWAAAIITQMSAYCSVASSLNETGSRFAPDDSAKRNYAAAATLRMLKCVKAQ